ncbi:hypothetical protein AB0395_39690 [Streptosporangium sp. NPDC051023]|uniref:hypothetical protein n=1 Tax=Streptosporangium sp. NPDC051023 TaxID=3155410 RepID=UPI00344C24DD
MADDTTTEQNDDSTTVEPTAEASATETSRSDDSTLGETGKTALQEERRARREADRALREAARVQRDLEKQLREFEDRDKSDLEKVTARAEGAENRIQGLITKAVRAEVRAFATPKFEDPGDAIAFLDLASYADDDGEIDAERIQADLADLLERKPHLAKKTPAPEPEHKRPAPDRTQASSANASRSSTPADEFAGFIQSRLNKGR